jgi:hypothetical protein
LSYRSTEHPSGREVDSGDGEEWEGKGSRDLEEEGGGPRVTESGRGRVLELESGDGEAATPTRWRWL